MGKTFVVVGGGQAGQSVVETLRRERFDGRILLIGDEPVQPYQRPPLSKGYLLGEMSRERLFFRSPSFYEEQGIEVRWNTRVAGIRRDTRELLLHDGETIPYTRLALTTGSRVRRLPPGIGGDLPGIYTVRTLADIDAMAQEFGPGRRVLVVGGGYIGLETAAVAAKLGLSVTLVEAAPRLLARVASAETAAYFRQLHESHGVRVITGTGLVRFEGGARAEAAVLADGNRIEIDFAVIGIGILPNVELAGQAGLDVDNGIAVDRQSRTSDPAIWAAGDCTSFPYHGRRIRLESVQNAIEQAEVAARAMMGHDADYDPVPWFWSDQYDVKLQIAGLSEGYDRIEIRPGRNETARSIWYFRAEAPIAVDAVNDARSFMQAKRMLADQQLQHSTVRSEPDPAQAP